MFIMDGKDEIRIPLRCHVFHKLQVRAFKKANCCIRSNRTLGDSGFLARIFRRSSVDPKFLRGSLKGAGFFRGSSKDAGYLRGSSKDTAPSSQGVHVPYRHIPRHVFYRLTFLWIFPREFVLASTVLNSVKELKPYLIMRDIE